MSNKDILNKKINIIDTMPTFQKFDKISENKNGDFKNLHEVVSEILESEKFVDYQVNLSNALQEKLLSRTIEKTDVGSNRIDDKIFKDLSAYKTGSGGFNAGNIQDSILKRKIIQYREISRNSELEDILNDIVNESVVNDTYDYPVKLQIDTNSNLIQRINPSIINRIYKTFTTILENLNFDIDGHMIFRRWFIDGRLYVQRKKNDNNITIEYEILDPLLLELIIDNEGVEDPYYLYYDNEVVEAYTEGNNNYGVGFNRGMQNIEAIRIEYKDVIAIYSGIYDYLLKFYLSPIESCMKILNQLANLEDAMVLHQFIRAVQRRLFKIDTGTLNSKQKEKYLNEVQKRHRESLNLRYNTAEGTIEGDDKVKFLSLFDDYWLATNANDNTTIENLDGSNGEWETITDKLSYFRHKLYRSMKVPFNRYDTQSNDGTEYKMAADSLARQDRKFQKYISALRKRFTELFEQLLEIEVLSNKILDTIEWRVLKKRITFEWEDDNFFTNIKNIEILEKRISAIQQIGFDPKEFFTRDYIHKEILGRNDEEIKEFERMLAIEKNKYGVEEDQEGELNGMGASEMGGIETGGFELPESEFGELPAGEEVGGELEEMNAPENEAEPPIG
jgi:hypothetical protein